MRSYTIFNLCTVLTIEQFASSLSLEYLAVIPSDSRAGKTGARISFLHEEEEEEISRTWISDAAAAATAMNMI